jgi:hypothetical protein
VAGRLAVAGAWRPGDGDIILVMDAGYDVTRLAWLLAGLPIVVCARLRSNRMFYGARRLSRPAWAAAAASTATRSSATTRRPGPARRPHSTPTPPGTAAHMVSSNRLRPSAAWSSHLS